MPSALLAERDTAVPNRFFFSSNHPLCFVLLCFSMPHSVAYCVSLHASSWYFRHRKMMARSTVWLLPIPMMRGGMARLRQHISIPGRTCRAAFLLVPVRVAIGNGSSIEWNQILNGWRKVCSRTSVPSPSCRSCLMWITCALLVDTQLLRCGVSPNRLPGEQPARRKVHCSHLFSLPKRPNVRNESCPTPNGHSPLPLSRGMLLNGTCGDAAMVRRWYYVVWLWGAPATYASVALDDQRYRNAAQEGCWCRRTEDPHFLT